MDKAKIVKEYLEEMLDRLYEIEELNIRNNAYSEELGKHILYVSKVIELIKENE